VSLALGSIKLEAPFFQAPLSGYSDRAMRILAREHGSALTFAPVMLAKSAASEGMWRKAASVVRDDEHPIGGQILGREPEIMAKAARALVQAGYDLIDLNFACPAPKVLRRKRGGYLLNEPQLLMQIYRRVRESVSCPVLMKLRAGYDGSSRSRDNFQRICRQAADEGIDALIIHGRTVVQRYRGKADWRIIEDLRQRLPHATIIGSGDLLSAEAVVHRLQSQAVDGVAIARGAVGNPWIFQQVAAWLDGRGPLPQPGLAEQGRMLLRHFELVSDIYRPGKALRYFRKFSVRYCRHHPQRKQVQMELMAAEDRGQVLRAINHWYGI